MRANPNPKDRAQNLAIAYDVKRRSKMAEGGKVMYTCPNCLAAGGRCYAHGGTVESKEPNNGPGPIEGQLDNEARKFGQKYPPEAKSFDMDHSARMQEPSFPFQKSMSPTMDRAVASGHSTSLAEAIMLKRKNRGSKVGHYPGGTREPMAEGGPVMAPKSPNPMHPSIDQNNARSRSEEESADPMNPYAPQPKTNPESNGSEGMTLNPNGPQEIESQKPDRYTMDGRRYADGGKVQPRTEQKELDPNEPQTIHNPPPMDAGNRQPRQTERQDKSLMMPEGDAPHTGPGAKQHYGDRSEDGIQSMHDYSVLPQSEIPEVSDPSHDSDMPDDAQQNSLIGQIMKKRRQLKRS